MRLSARRVIIAGLAVLAGVTTGGCSSTARLADANSAVGVSPVGPAATAALPQIAVTGAPSGVLAKAGMLADASTDQVLWSKGLDIERPMASITKVMTAYLVISAGGLDRKITVPPGVLNYVARYGASSDDLEPGEVLTAGELLYGLLLQSGADAAYTLANAYGPGLDAFVARMNATAQQLGMAHTHFTSPDGLPYPTETSTYSTPADLLILGKTAMKSAVFRSIVDQRFYTMAKGGGHDAHWWGNENQLIGNYPGAVGIKTGYTDIALHCLLFEAIRNGRTLIGVVLGSPATGPGAGAADAERVLNWGFALKKISPQ